MQRIVSATRNHTKGGVSIFIVVFTALMVTIVTASFVQIVLRNQQIATSNDLSQSAYDSAMAGVEDAKRALVKLRQCENDPSNDCELSIRSALETNQCNSLQTAGVVTFTNNEVRVGGSAQNQAYTCVKVVLDTDDVSGSLDDSGSPVVIPLKAKDAFDKVRVSWFSADDLPEGSALSVPSSAPVLPAEGSWPNNRPPMLRAQLIQFKEGNIQLSQFVDGNARTLFFYPSSLIDSLGGYSFASDMRMNPASSVNIPKTVNCTQANLMDEAGGYACWVDLALPDPIGGDKNSREAYLELQAIYGATTYKVELLSNGTETKFNGVQPAVDSTGRADDYFRRVRSNLRITDGAIEPFFPNAALSVGGNLCKDFFVTDKATDYAPGNCSPE